MSKGYSQEKQCLICGQNLSSDPSCFGLFRDKHCQICGQCRMSFVPSKRKGVLYEYNEFFRSLLFRYKALGDLALAPVFLDGLQGKLKRKYRGYVIICVPSCKEENLARGFAVLPWIFQSLTLPIEQPFEKKEGYKQATSKHRRDIYQAITLHNIPPIKNKKVLLVDDVITSGHTLNACRLLLEPYQPKCIDVLVLAGKSKQKKY